MEAQKEVNIKPHTRKSKNGKQFQVKGYTRRVGRKGVHSPKKGSSWVSVAAGDEFEAKKSEKPQQEKYTTNMTDEEIATWDKLARANSMENYGGSKYRSKKKKQEKATDNVKGLSKRKEGILDRLEKKLKRYIKKNKF